MNACVETVPSQIPIDLVSNEPVTHEPAAPEPVAQKLAAHEPVAQSESGRPRRTSGASPADFQSEATNQTMTATKCSWFSSIWSRARKTQPKQNLLAALPVGALPGVGQTHAKTLVDRGVTTVGQLRRIPKPVLVAAFGKAIGKHIWESARSMEFLPR
jgi:hypothetical protein